MDVLIFLIFFLLGVGFSFFPSFSKKLSSFFDTVIHEAGHGLASLPFGAPLPSITVRKNTSGETLSSMGYLHQLLPFGLGKVTEKIARFLSLMAGYPASIILASVLMVLALTESQSFDAWIIAFLAQVALGTILWTLVRITDSPWTFLLILIIVSGFYYLLLPWDWKIYLGILLGAVVLVFIAKSWLSSIAVILTITSALSFILGITLGKDHPLAILLDDYELTIESYWIARGIFALLFIFVLFCCRSWLSAGLSILILGACLGALFIPTVNYSYVLAVIAGILYTSGVKSFTELHRLTFGRSRDPRSLPDTDMVFAAQELGGEPAVWYWVTVTVAILSVAGIFLWGYFY